MDKQQYPSQDNLPPESDTARLVRRHLSDPNHVFTEEELASIRVGSTPTPDVSSGLALEDEDDVVGQTTDQDNQPINESKETTTGDAID